MAQDDQRRKNFWDEEEDDEAKPASGNSPSGSTAGADSVEIDRKINEAKVLMDHIHQLYLHFFNGVEKRVPIEKVKLLETKINELQRTNTNLTTARFKVNQFLSQYKTIKELWERKLRERERK